LRAKEAKKSDVRTWCLSIEEEDAQIHMQFCSLSVSAHKRANTTEESVEQPTKQTISMRFDLLVPDEDFGALARRRFHATEAHALASGRLELPTGLQEGARAQETW